MAVSTFNFLVSDAVSGSGGSGRDGRTDTTSKETNSILKEGNILSRRSIQQNLGLQLSVAAILKQSQIFTGFIGSLFQILGAFVDVALMSVFPLLKSSLKVLMKFFEPIKTISSGVGSIVGGVMKVFGAVVDGYEKIRNVVSTVIDYIPGIGNDESSRAVGLGAGGLAAAATKAARAGAKVGKVIPGAGLALGAYGAFEGFEREGMVGVIKETVNFALSSIFGAAGFAGGNSRRRSESCYWCSRSCRWTCYIRFTC